MLTLLMPVDDAMLISNLVPKDDICVAKYDFDGKDLRCQTVMVGWFLVGKARMERNKLIKL